MERGIVSVTQLVKWYADDFGATEHERLAWINQHLTGEKSAALSQLLAANRDYKIVYLPYDWGNNNKEN